MKSKTTANAKAKVKPTQWNRAANTLVWHAVRNLPDSLFVRKDVLEAVAVHLRHDSPGYLNVKSQLAVITALEKLNYELLAEVGA